MTTLDWLLLCFYMLLTIGLGLWVSRSQRDASDYLLGGGSLGWFTVGISLIATSMSASTFLGLPTYAYQHDFALLLNQLGALLSVAIVARFFIGRYRRAKVQSAYELLELKFSRSVRVLGALFYCAHLLLRSGLLIYGPALVLSQLLAWPLLQTIALTAFLSMVYTAFGGLKAVVLTDTIQFFVLLLGALMTLVMLNAQVPLGELWSMAESAGRTRILPADHSTTSWLSPQDAGSVLSATLIYAVLEVAIRGCDQQFVQRYLSCSSERSAVRSSYLAIFVGAPAAYLFFAIGACLYAYYQLHVPEVGVPTANMAYPHFMLHHLPSGVRGLLVAAILAASMSSFDSAINALNNTALVDLLKRDPSQPKSLVLARYLALPWGLLSLGAAITAATMGKGLLIQALYFTSLFTGPLLALITLAFFAPVLSSLVVWWSVAGGMLALVLVSPPPFLDLHEAWLSWPYNPLVSCGTTWLLAMMFYSFRRRAEITV